ncbi:hypothetical protein K8R04_04725 [Candidatus Uhrbacteria bacterium]|nr:hypothetical protein [Candidatus Uhrbacteria bacterium]
MSRQIFLIAREFLAAGTELDRQTARFIETQRELHSEVHTELQSYGTVVKQRTSGIFPRVNTPPFGMTRDGIPGETTLVEPESHPTTLKARERRKEIPDFFRKLFSSIQTADCVVIIRDGQNDLRGAIAMYVHMLEIPMLALQQEPRGMHLPGDPLYDLPNITNIRFHDFSEAKNPIRRFMNEISVRYAAG